MHIKVKNMVCDRCKSVLKRELQKAGIEVVQIELGEVELSEGAKGQMGLIWEILMQNGFELIEDQEDSFIAEIKKNLIIALENGIHQNLSDHLSKNMKKEYSMLSKMFSAKEGVTIERYFILLKIERVKEQIQMGSKTFSEIAYDLDYASSSHLAKQFKSVTGMSMTDYRKVQQWNRKSLDQIV